MSDTYTYNAIWCLRVLDVTALYLLVWPCLPRTHTASTQGANSGKGVLAVSGAQYGVSSSAARASSKQQTAEGWWV